MRIAVVAAALVLAGCAAPHLTLFGGKPPAQTAPQPAAERVCTPEEASPVPDAPLATNPLYTGFLLVAPVTDAEKAGFEVARRYFADLLSDDQTKTARLRRAAQHCAALR